MMGVGGLVLIRHGETEWSRSGRYAGRTDVPLTAAGVAAARALAPALAEWDYGGYEGLTAAQIRATTPGWSLWRDAIIPGDVDHPGEQLRDVAARWLDLDPSLGRLFRHPPPGTLSVLGTEDVQTVVSSDDARRSPSQTTFVRQVTPVALASRESAVTRTASRDSASAT
ncbi:MAG: hypothetical protein QG671_1141 [Actinomycetota bacterium]|nr:hypothetical protein [Actinomycetota bacterium]